VHCTCSVSNQGQRIGYKGDQWVGGANYYDTEVKQQYNKYRHEHYTIRECSSAGGPFLVQMELKKLLYRPIPPLLLIKTSSRVGGGVAHY